MNKVLLCFFFIEPKSLQGALEAGVEVVSPGLSQPAACSHINLIQIKICSTAGQTSCNHDQVKHQDG